jgi:apyrase
MRFIKVARASYQDLPLRHLAVSFAFLLAAAPAGAAERAAYVGVIDAGSSGSRLSVYKYGADGRSLEDLVELSTAAQPLASHAAAPDTAGDKAIGPLIGALDRELAQRGVAKTDIEIHLLATGGMRLLPAPAAQAIQASVTRTLREGGYRPGRVETISGEMEGFYAWLDVNVLLGQLGPGKTPAGIVEIGGASVQMAYAGAPASAPGVVTASFGGQTYSVRSVSFLGLGVEQARKTLLDNGDGAPCYPEGLASAMPERNGARGAFDAERCARAISRIVEAPTRSLPPDEIRNVRFLGLGKPLTGVLADWKLPQDNGGALKATAGEKCLQPWAVFTREHGDTRYTPYLCVNSIYLSTLLFDARGLGLAPGQVTAADSIAGRSPSWTRGAALMMRAAQ